MLTSILVLALAAPAPKYKELPKPTIGPGVYKVSWCGMLATEVHLYPDGTYRWPFFEHTHCGSWQFDQKTNTLHFCNREITKSDWTRYAFKMSASCDSGVHKHQTESGLDITYGITCKRSR